MSRRMLPLGAALVTVVLFAGVASAADKPAGLDQSGTPDIKSAGPLAFGPEGVLFVADPQGAAIFAIGVPPAGAASPAGQFKIEGIDGKVAALLGTSASDLLVNDLAVQPGTGVAYLSVSRGKGPDAEPAIIRAEANGKLALLPLEKVNFAKVELKNVPGPQEKDRRGNPTRQESITDLHFVEGKLFVAGLSNEDFASRLRAIAFPFEAADQGTGVEIYHGAHGQLETRAPVRTFVPFNIGGEPHLLAAYTCTPLVTFPVSKLKTGEKLRGTTVAELGNMNRPLDMIVYVKDGRQFLLVANTNRGVMKVTTDNVEKQEGINQPIKGTAGLGYETIAELKGVTQLDKLGDQYALLLLKVGEGYNLQSVPLP